MLFFFSFWQSFLDNFDRVVSCGFVYLSFEIVFKFFSGKTVLKISKQQYPIIDVQLPAITVCPDVLYDPKGDSLRYFIYHNHLRFSNYKTDFFVSDLKKRTQYD